ncbi:unnamed protein product [Peronospora belbahrii]|uniref:Uncharacterized protein n=1 Tax=Peronospora belbahrii TaxID=622444 RepID=A0AAU9L1C9_9STRA|nr:unnamed protein product [Peronospora belbahrii]
MTEEASEYEVKRQRRIAANQEKLQELQIVSLSTNPSLAHECTKRKRGFETLQRSRRTPTRRSLRQVKKDKVMEQEQCKAVVQEEERNTWQDVEKGGKTEQNWLKKKKTRDKSVKSTLEARRREEEEVKAATLFHGEDRKKDEVLDAQEEQWKRLDWRMRRKLQLRKERRQVTVQKREEKKRRRLKEKVKWERIRARERKAKKRQKERDKLEKSVQKELALQQRMEEGELMRQEDRLARSVVKQRVKDEKMKKRHDQNALVKVVLDDTVVNERQRLREKEDTWRREIYPVQRIHLPLVMISDPIGSYKTKPLVLSSLLNVDVDLFHAFSLGKQFLPPGKKAVMQGLCPGGFITAFQEHADIHVWKNAMTLFVSGTTGLFYHYMFEETRHDGRIYVYFRWSRSKDVTPPILWRMCQVQKGEEHLRLNKSYYDAATPTQNPESLLLFVQYPKGPYIYCGRLGYLGHQPNPLEFSFQLLDTNALNWRRIRTLLTSCSS